MNLLIVESPSKARTIENYLGKDFMVASSFGHIRGIPSKPNSVDVKQDFSVNYEVNDGARKHIQELIKAAKKADTIFLATDPDREGEAISWHIAEVLHEADIKKDMKRVVFYEITKAAVNRAIAEPRAIDQDLVEAQQARQTLDYLVGFTLSPVLWRKLPGSKSAGRVQSVVLRLLCSREDEIGAFVIQEYWSVSAFFDKSEAALVKYNSTKLQKHDIKDEKQANDMVKTIKKSSFSVTSVQKKQIKRNPKAPFTTSTMLQGAFQKYGFSSKKTMMLAQRLYEGVEIGGKTVGMITYMRTDSVVMSNDAISHVRSVIPTQYGPDYLPAKPNVYKTKVRNAQEAHEAIRPTDFSMTPKDIEGKVPDDLFKLYSLIWSRATASQMEVAILDSTTVLFENPDGAIQFKTSGNRLVFPGFYAAYNYDDDKEEKLLPDFSEGQEVSLGEVVPNQHFTQPPPRYTEATLVKKMEELGIGRPSTYSGTISVLLARDYMVSEKKRFTPTPRGRIVTAFLVHYFSKYFEYQFTADLEEVLDDISNGKKKNLTVLNDFWGPFNELCDTALKLDVAEISKFIDNGLLASFFGSEDAICPNCKSPLTIKIGKFNPFFGCSKYPECSYIKSITAGEQGGESKQISQELGKNDEGENIYLKNGPYGHYIQVGEAGDGKKVKRTKLPNMYAPTEVDLELALKLASLPKQLGEHEGESVTVEMSRYGPCIRQGRIYASIKGDLFEVTLADAVKMIEEKKKSMRKKSAKPAKTGGKAKSPKKKAKK